MSTYRVTLDHICGDRTKEYNCVIKAPTAAAAVTEAETFLAAHYGEDLSGCDPTKEYTLLDGMIRIRPHSVELLADDSIARADELIRLEDLGAGD